MKIIIQAFLIKRQRIEFHEKKKWKKIFFVREHFFSGWSYVTLSFLLEFFFEVWQFRSKLELMIIFGAYLFSIWKTHKSVNFCLNFCLKFWGKIGKFLEIFLVNLVLSRNHADGLAHQIIFFSNFYRNFFEKGGRCAKSLQKPLYTW